MRMTIKNDLNEIENISYKIEQFSEQHQLPQKTLFQINVCLDELLTNTINYGYNDEEEHLISLTITLEEDVAVITIVDDSRAFNPLEMAEPDLERSVEEREIGGLGIHIVKRMMDEMYYSREDGKNRLVLKKQLNKMEAKNGNQK